MVRSLLLVWILAVIAFFVLWALIALMVRHISEKRETRTKQEENAPEEMHKEEIPESLPRQDQGI